MASVGRVWTRCSRYQGRGGCHLHTGGALELGHPPTRRANGGDDGISDGGAPVGAPVGGVGHHQWLLHPRRELHVAGRRRGRDGCHPLRRRRTDGGGGGWRRPRQGRRRVGAEQAPRVVGVRRYYYPSRAVAGGPTWRQLMGDRVLERPVAGAAGGSSVGGPGVWDLRRGHASLDLIPRPQWRRGARWLIHPLLRRRDDGSHPPRRLCRRRRRCPRGSHRHRRGDCAARRAGLCRRLHLDGVL